MKKPPAEGIVQGWRFFTFEKNIMLVLQIGLSKISYKEESNLIDQGSNPLVIDICKAVQNNNAFRAALWTGKHLQITLMSIPVCGEIGLEAHPHLDQFLRIESGQGIVTMGPSEDRLTQRQMVSRNSVIVIPAGTWHNLINAGNRPMKLYSIYSPPEHPKGTHQFTKAEADLAEEH